MSLEKSPEKYRLICDAFLERYKYEELCSNDINKELIKGFSGGKNGYGLEKFLKENAWSDSEEGKTKVYLIKEIVTGKIKAYFSIKCGMLYSPYDVDRLSGEEKDFLELFLDGLREKNDTLITEYLESGVFSDEKIKKIYSEAKRIIECERHADTDKNREFAVDKTFPAIEIENLCKNYADENDASTVDRSHVDNKTIENKIQFGLLVFWFFIIPIIEDISDRVGCEYIYIFAADQSKCVENNPKGWKLVSYYRENFGFHDSEELFFIRPDYDDDCYEMIQAVAEAMEKKKSIWERYGDILKKIDNIESIIP